jgi:hypothetical protein
MRENNFSRRLKAGMSLIFKKKNAMIMVCEQCGGTNIVPISNALQIPFTVKDVKSDIAYLQFSKCSKCGAVCKELQLWNFGGKAEELEPKIKVMEDSDVQN